MTLTVHFEYVKYLKEYDGSHGEILPRSDGDGRRNLQIPAPIEKPEIVEGK